MTKECGLRQEKERKTKEKCVNRAKFLTHTLVPVELVPPSLRTTPSPPYVADHAEDPEHSSVPEFWVDPVADQ
jgi:hypothetical protein